MELIKYLNESFWGDSGYVLLFAVAVIFILVEKTGDDRGKIMAVYSALVFIGVICNPILGAVATGKFMSDDRSAYLRIFYLIPLMSIIAYAATKFYVKQAPKEAGVGKKILIAAIICVTVLLTGELYGSGMYAQAENIYKISQDALEIGTIILDDCGEQKARTLLPDDEDIVFGIRQYTADIIVAGYSDEVQNSESLAVLEQEKDYSYIVIEKNVTLEGILEAAGYSVVGDNFSYIVYKK